MLQQRLLQQQQQGISTAGMPGMPGAGGGLNVIGNTLNTSAGIPSNNNNDWRNGQHEGLRREMLLLL